MCDEAMTKRDWLLFLRQPEGTMNISACEGARLNAMSLYAV